VPQRLAQAPGGVTDSPEPRGRRLSVEEVVLFHVVYPDLFGSVLDPKKPLRRAWISVVRFAIVVDGEEVVPNTTWMSF